VQLLSLNIPPESIKIHHLEVGVLRDEFSSSEREKMLAQAETQIRNISDSLGIMKTAQENASAFMMNLMKQNGYETVTINFKNRP
jgi:transcription initiation factor TFIIIB Brf1 subunit/transcription initiation factor TFIIB